MSDYPKVSVVTITYGHKNYITQALDGVMMQEYPGEIEFIIVNDNSPDATDEVVKKYFLENPAPRNFQIRYVKHENNKGMMPNFIWALEQATGKYIALCEGDDYWTDPFKSQIQIDFLEQNHDVSLCFHPAKRYDEFQQEFSESAPLEQRIYEGEELLTNWIIPTASVVFRRASINKKVYDRLQNSNYLFGDIILFLSLAEKGKVFCINQKMSVYRVHDNGIMRTLGREPKINGMRYINHHLQMSDDFRGRYRRTNFMFVSERYYRFFIEEDKLVKKIYYFVKYNYFISKSSFMSLLSKKHLKTVLFHILPVR